MSIQTQDQLTTAQASIYSRSNIRRAFSDFDEADIAGIYLRDATCLVVRRDGSEQTYDRSLRSQLQGAIYLAQQCLHYVQGLEL
jgi:hypothetical protein